MVVTNNFYFLKDVTSPQISEETHNMQGESLNLQVEGDAQSFSLKVYGCSDMKSEEFHLLTAITTDYELIDNLTSKGIYTYSIEGVAKIKVDLSAITGGKLSAFGKITKGV